MQQLKRMAALAIGVAALLVPATVAQAATAPGYEEFGDCPDRSVNSGISFCAITEITAGHLTLGSKTTPIEDPIKLVVGITGTGQAVVGSFDGGRQKVPGGLVGLTGLDWLTALLPGNLLEVYAEAELVGPVTNPVSGPVGLPLRVQLDNPLFNDSCYIGSSSNPIDLHLTTGTTSPPPPNQPISGQVGTPTHDPVLAGVIRSSGLILVDNAFAAPAAQGCDVLSLGITDLLVNAQSGLPSPAGTNEAVQEGNGSIGQISSVYPPSGFEQ